MRPTHGRSTRMGVQAERPCVYLRTAAAIILEVPAGNPPPAAEGFPAGILPGLYPYYRSLPLPADLIGRRGGESMEEMANLISNFGFPIVLVIYLFTRFERLFAEVIDSIERLEDLIQEHFRQEKE